MVIFFTWNILYYEQLLLYLVNWLLIQYSLFETPATNKKTNPWRKYIRSVVVLNDYKIRFLSFKKSYLVWLVITFSWIHFINSIKLKSLPAAFYLRGRMLSLAKTWPTVSKVRKIDEKPVVKIFFYKQAIWYCRIMFMNLQRLNDCVLNANPKGELYGERIICIWG